MGQNSTALSRRREGARWLRAALAIAMAIPASSPAVAGELFSPLVTVKPLGMGGAYTAIAGDHNAPFTNPAGTTRVKKARGQGYFHHLQAPNLVVGANGSGKELFGVLQGTKSWDEALSTVGSGGAWALASISPMAVFQYQATMITVGAAVESMMSAIPNSADATLMDIKASMDTAPYINFGWHDRSNLISGAIQVRSIQRTATEMTLPASVLGDKSAVDAAYRANTASTQGLAVDAGLLLTFADFWYPTLGIAVFNLPLGCQNNYLNPFSKARETVCGTVFSGSNPDAISATDPTDFRLGFSISPRMGRTLGIRMALDYHHIYLDGDGQSYGLSQIPISKQLHAGFQIYQGNPLLPAPFAVSFGVGQGSPSFGVSANLEGFQIELTTYGRDISPDATPQEDRRTILSLSYSG